jgi:hypothetical protein
MYISLIYDAVQPLALHKPDLGPKFQTSAKEETMITLPELEYIKRTLRDRSKLLPHLYLSFSLKKL